MYAIMGKAQMGTEANKMFNNNALTGKLKQPYAGVVCTRRKNMYIVKENSPEFVILVKSETQVVPLAENEVVVTETGEKLLPSDGYFRTTSTTDPHHVVLDIPGNLVQADG